MSYLDTPRICFRGHCRFSGPTRNNLLVGLDYPAILTQSPAPDWNYNPGADGDFVLDARVVAAWDAMGRLITDPAGDAVIGAQVYGAGKMADLDPEHRRVTDLVGMELVVSLPGTATMAGQVAITQLRDYWSDRLQNTATAWQSTISPRWSAGIEQSRILRHLRDADVPGLSIRLMPYAGTTQSGIIMGIIGPWSPGEPRQFVAARRLITRRPAGQYPFPVATCLVAAPRRRLVADLGNLPIDPTQLPPSDKPFIKGLVACILQTDKEGGGVLSCLEPALDLSYHRWASTCGVVEWVLTSKQLGLLADHRLRFTFTLGDEPLVMEEHPSGCYVDVDRRSLRLDPGGSATVDVYARRLGRPYAGLVVNFSLHQQTALAAVESILDPPDFGYPTDPNRLINGEPREVLFDRPGPLQVMTDRDGFARLTIEARTGEFVLPCARQTIDSQLYFLGEPDGWQSWGAIGPNNGPLASHRVGAACALAVLVHNTHRSCAHPPRWADIREWMARYALLYQAMKDEAHIDLGDEDQVKRNAREIYRRLKCVDFEDVQYMPVSRDLSAYRRQMILSYLRSVMPGDPPC